MSLPQLVAEECIILINESLSSSVDLDGGVVDAIMMPAAGWNAATISFEGSMDNINWFEIGDGTAEVSLVADAGWIVLIPPHKLDGAGRYLKIRSGTSVVPVAQAGAERTLTVLKRF